MHIVLGLAGAIVTILILLHRLAEAGIDLGGLNPFLSRRRRAFREKFEANPIFSLEDPREIAAVLVVGTAKIDGDMSAEEKRTLLAELESTFALDAGRAAELLTSTVHLLGDVSVLRTQLADVLRTAQKQFSDEQATSLLAVMERIAAVDGPPTEQQRELIEGTRAHFESPATPAGTWG